MKYIKQDKINIKFEFAVSSIYTQLHVDVSRSGNLLVDQGGLLGSIGTTFTLKEIIYPICIMSQLIDLVLSDHISRDKSNSGGLFVVVLALLHDSVRTKSLSCIFCAFASGVCLDLSLLMFIPSEAH